MISILMPVKNEKLYLEECIRSIISQSEVNWELIAIDDHSSDSSAEILKNFSAQDKRIKYYLSNGQGIIDALRMSLSLSSGHYITRMDADDIMSTHKLKLLKKELNNNGNGCISTGLVKYISSNELGNGFIRYAQWLNGLTKNATNFSEIYKECSIPSPCWMMYRSDLLKLYGFDNSIYPEDYDMCFRLKAANYTIAPVQEIIHYWRDHPERASRNDPRYADHTFLDIKLKYFCQLDYNSDRQLIIWGVGKKGKEAARYFENKNIPFKWICNNPKKIGKKIYNQLIESDDTFECDKKMQIIILVAAPKDQKNIGEKLSAHSLNKNVDYFFFC